MVSNLVNQEANIILADAGLTSSKFIEEMRATVRRAVDEEIRRNEEEQNQFVLRPVQRNNNA